MATIKCKDLEALKYRLLGIAEECQGMSERLRDAFPEVREVALSPGNLVSFNSRGRAMDGVIGEVSEDKASLYVYVRNADGFGTTGYRIRASAVIQPEVERGDDGTELAVLLERAARIVKAADK